MRQDSRSVHASAVTAVGWVASPRAPHASTNSATTPTPRRSPSPPWSPSSNGSASTLTTARPRGWLRPVRPAPRHPRTAPRRGQGAAGTLRAVWLEQNEWAQAQQRGEEYWLYVVDSCATTPQVRLRQRDPAAVLGGPRRIERFQIPVSELHRLIGVQTVSTQHDTITVPGARASPESQATDPAARLIDTWFPCPEVDAAVGTPAGSGLSEKALFTWFASRPIAQARAAVLCSLLPDTPDNRTDIKTAILMAMPPPWRGYAVESRSSTVSNRRSCWTCSLAAASFRWRLPGPAPPPSARIYPRSRPSPGACWPTIRCATGRRNPHCRMPPSAVIGDDSDAGCLAVSCVDAKTNHQRRLCSTSTE